MIHTDSLCPVEVRESANIQSQRWNVHTLYPLTAATAESASGLPYMSGNPPHTCTHTHTHTHTHNHPVHVATRCQKRQGGFLLNFSNISQW